MRIKKEKRSSKRKKNWQKSAEESQDWVGFKVSITKSMSWEIGERKILKEKRKKELESLKEKQIAIFEEEKRRLEEKPVITEKLGRKTKRDWKDYIRSKEEFTGVQIREHIDDGYTGTNFVEVG